MPEALVGSTIHVVSPTVSKSHQHFSRRSLKSFTRQRTGSSKALEENRLLFRWSMPEASVGSTIKVVSPTMSKSRQHFSRMLLKSFPRQRTGTSNAMEENRLLFRCGMDVTWIKNFAVQCWKPNCAIGLHKPHHKVFQTESEQIMSRMMKATVLLKNVYANVWSWGFLLILLVHGLTICQITQRKTGKNLHLCKWILTVRW